jgi:hypothetical protein
VADIVRPRERIRGRAVHVLALAGDILETEKMMIDEDGNCLIDGDFCGVKGKKCKTCTRKNCYEQGRINECKTCTRKNCYEQGRINAYKEVLESMDEFTSYSRRWRMFKLWLEELMKYGDKET